MKTSWGSRIPRRAPEMLLYVVAVALGITWFRAGAETLARNRLLLGECDRLSAEVDQVQQQNLQLRRERAALAQDPFYIERVLREDRGLVATGETRLDPIPARPPRVHRAERVPDVRSARREAGSRPPLPRR